MAANPIHVEHVRRHLDEALVPHIDIEDIKNLPEENLAEARRSRALAALAVQYLTKCSETDAAMSVIDGKDDNGIDAIAWDLDAAHLYLVQAKWSKDGKASLNAEAAGKLERGLRLITDRRHEEFNARYQELVDYIDLVVDQPRFKVTLVPILMGTANIDERAAGPITDVVAELNSVHDCARVEYLRLPEIHRIVADGVHTRPVDLKVHLENSACVSEPYLAYYGCVSAEELASWYDEHRDRLFDKNLRDALNGSDVNASLHHTLVNEPDNFWYFNNGITVLCKNIERSGRGALRYSGSANLLLEGASVVNGAQTVSTIFRAVRENPETAGSALVWIRAVQLEENGFAERVTETNNTQNAVDLRDFAALDPTQKRLRDDFRSMNLTYIVKRGEREIDPDKGCDIEEAAHALAAAARTTDVIVDVHRDPNKLWLREQGGRYSQLFHPKIREIRVWRTVRLYRGTQRRISERESGLEKRAKGFAKNLGHLVAHVVLRHLVDETIERPGREWVDKTLSKVSVTTDRVLDFLIAEADRRYVNYFPASLANSFERCRELALAAADHLAADGPAPVLSPEYRGDVTKPRSETAAKTIYNYEAIEPDTKLEFRALTARERKLVNHWLNTDQTRRFAKYIPSKTKILLWEHDGLAYTATGLTNKIWREATGKSDRAIQGTLYWYVPGRGSLADIAEEARRDHDGSDAS
ncbi:AIPR family protein [Glycomyces harbinensis]|uniref:AIPR protein n=1 Tax=Glycomyces harbinensis TaxID=58114 RepID=A0A1G7B0J3_9ACTN|nr:AIPR family protein [Glycomyces harbinensis]SDE20541.1 AIPR protein [Glycomyces harbinensis]